jgi:Mor family transcriptional regulator
MAGSDSLEDDVYEEVFAAARKLGVSRAISDDMARMVDAGIRRRCGGDRLYVPVLDSHDIDQQLLVARLAGATVRELADKFKMKKSTVYDRLKKLKN